MSLTPRLAQGKRIIFGTDASPSVSLEFGNLVGAVYDAPMELVVDTVEGSTNFWEHTLAVEDLPKRLDGFKAVNYFPVICAQFENLDSVNRIINARPTWKGNIGQDESGSITSGNFGRFLGMDIDLLTFPDVAINIADTFGFRAWADVTNEIRLNKVHIAIFPFTMVAQNGMQPYNSNRGFEPLPSPLLAPTVINYFEITYNINAGFQGFGDFTDMIGIVKGTELILDIQSAGGNMNNTGVDDLQSPSTKGFGSYTGAF